MFKYEFHEKIKEWRAKEKREIDKRLKGLENAHEKIKKKMKLC